MALVSILHELKKAQRGRYAVPLFDVFDMSAAEGIFRALVEKRSPGIVAIYSSFIESPSARGFSSFLRTMAEDADVPISVMLDHGGSYEQCGKALDWGFADVMFDGSGLSLEENAAITRKVVETAHRSGAAVEAELGSIGSGRDYQEYGARRMGFTDPVQAQGFIEQTGAHFLAIAVGTAHGVYQGEPRIDCRLIEEIRRRVPVPLVLHGGSGLSAEQYRKAIESGICKINVSTNLARAAADAMKAKAKEEGASYFGMIKALRDAYQEEASRYLEIFGSAGKA